MSHHSQSIKGFCPKCFNVMRGVAVGTNCMFCRTPMVHWTKKVEKEARDRDIQRLKEERGDEVMSKSSYARLSFSNSDGSGGKVPIHKPFFQ